MRFACLFFLVGCLPQAPAVVPVPATISCEYKAVDLVHVAQNCVEAEMFLRLLAAVDPDCRATYYDVMMVIINCDAFNQAGPPYGR